MIGQIAKSNSTACIIADIALLENKLRHQYILSALRKNIFEVIVGLKEVTELEKQGRGLEGNSAFRSTANILQVMNLDTEAELLEVFHDVDWSGRARPDVEVRYCFVFGTKALFGRVVKLNSVG